MSNRLGRGDPEMIRLLEAEIAADAKRKATKKVVYFIKAGDAVKIGMAWDAQARLADLQVANPIKLELMFTVPGGREVEAQFHKRFSAHALHGEWFKIEGALRLFIIMKRRAAGR